MQKSLFTGGLGLALGVLATLSLLFLTITPEKPGAVGGNTIQAESIVVNGVETFQYIRSLYAATTTVCAIKSPSATSTLAGGGIRMTTSSTTASTLTIARAATAYATTTTILSQAVAAGAQISVPFASTSPSNTYTDRVFAPGTFLVVGMQGGIGSFSPVGSCSALFQVL